jgi:two-component sensor histidine kinase
MVTRLAIYVTLVVTFLIGCTPKEKKIPGSETAKIQDLLYRSNNTEFNSAEKIELAKQADSLSLVNNEIELHLKSLVQLATLYGKYGKNDSALLCYATVAVLSQKLKNFKIKANAFANIGLILNEESNYDSALTYYDTAIAIFRIIKDSSHLAQLLVDAGISLKNQGKFQEAFNKTLEATSISESSNDSKTLLSAYTNLGNILKDLKKYDDALTYQLKALSILKQSKDSAASASVYNNIGNIYKNQGSYINALNYYEKSLAIKERIGNIRSAGTTLGNIAEIYLKLKQYNKADSIFIIALEIKENAKDYDGYFTYSNMLAKLYLAEGKLERAKDIATRASRFSITGNLFKQQLDNFLILESIYRQEDNFKYADSFGLLAINLKDSLFNSDMATAISKMNVRFKTEQKEHELQLSRQNQLSQAEKLKNQYQFILILGISILLLLIIITLLFRSNKNRIKAKKKVETLMRELSHRVKNNLQLISDMLHLQLYITKEADQVAIIQSNINRVQSINIIHGLLYSGDYKKKIDIKDFIEALLNNLCRAYEPVSSKFRTVTNLQPMLLDLEIAIPLGLITNEIITNIFKYSKTELNDIYLEIKILTGKEKWELWIVDNCGYWNFQKISKEQKGLGLFIIENLTKQIGCDWNIEINEIGTTQKLEFNQR